MKVLYLFGSLNRGGTETLMLDVFRNAKKCDLDAVGVYRKAGVCEEDFLQSGVPMTYLPTGKNLLKYIFRLRKQLRREQAGIVHAMQPLDAVYAWLATLAMQTKVVLTLHGFDFGSTPFGLFLNRCILPRTTCNLYVSAYQRNYYQEKYHLVPTKQEVVYNGIAMDKIDQATVPAFSLREELKIPEGVLLLGMVGNFNVGRDPLTVCRFLKLLDTHSIDFRFVFVGKAVEGYDSYKQCRHYCEQHNLTQKVCFLGGRPDVPAILKQLDAFVYSTVHDTFGIAVVEAMATGIPVFVNDWAVMQEITENGKYAHLYRSADPESLYRTFLDYLQHKETQDRAALAHSTEIQKKYSIAAHIDALKKVYKHLLIQE